MSLRRILAASTFFLTCAVAGALILAKAHAAEDTPVTHGFDVSNMDRTCKPCDDFFQYANGNWLKKNPIPADYPVWGSFVTLSAQNQTELRGILETASTNTSAAAGSNEQ